MNDLEKARAKFRAVQQGEDPLVGMIPPGYRLTKQARLRMAALAQMTSRNERRMLEKFWKKQDAKTPFETFEPV